MTKKINQKTLDKAAEAILTMPVAEHKRPKEPTKAELNKKFVMRVAEDGRATVIEV